MAPLKKRVTDLNYPAQRKSIVREKADG